MASCAAATLAQWERLPDDLLLRVLRHVLLGWDGRRSWCSDVRGGSRQWRDVHDVACSRLSIRREVTDIIGHGLIAQLPSLTSLELAGSAHTGGTPPRPSTKGRHHPTIARRSTRPPPPPAPEVPPPDGLRAVGGMPALTELFLYNCLYVTDAVLRELRGLTALTTLGLDGCTKVTDVGLQQLTALPALTHLTLYDCATTQAGRNALKAALPALTIYPRDQL